MQSARPEQPAGRPMSVKFVVSGGFGAGKTTFVGSVSEIQPLRTEASMTMNGFGLDDASSIPGKTTTTVAMDFGRLTVEANLVLYLFGTPGQDRFGFMWDDVIEGGLGAIVIVDTRRLHDSYPAIDYFESRGVPFVVAVNQFAGAPRHDVDEVRYALAIGDEVPLVVCDAREADSARDVLVVLCTHVLARLEDSAGAATSPADGTGHPVAAECAVQDASGEAGSGEAEPAGPSEDARPADETGQAGESEHGGGAAPAGPAGPATLSRSG